MNIERNCETCKYYKDGYCENLELKPCYPQKGCDDFSKRNELKNDYKRGWHDALSKALDEAYTIHIEEGIFEVVQAETLIGLGYAIDELVAESEEQTE